MHVPNPSVRAYLSESLVCLLPSRRGHVAKHTLAITTRRITVLRRLSSTLSLIG